jgi:hypothetical protein
LLLLAAALLLVGGLVAQASGVGGFLGHFLPSPAASRSAIDVGPTNPPSESPIPSVTPSASATPRPGSANLPTPTPVGTPSIQPTTFPSITPSTTATPRPTSAGPPEPSGLFGMNLPWQVPAADLPGATGVEINDVEAVPTGFVAVGTGSGRGAVWTSPDGLSWTGMLLPDAPALVRVVAGPSGLVAIGDDEIWVSQDGSTWSKAPHPPATGAVLVDIGYGPDGYAAVGRSGLNSTTAAVWTSSDGLTWTRVRAQGAFAQFCPLGIAVGTEGLVAVGNDCAADGHAVAVSTPDSVQWSRQTDGAPFEGPLAAITASDRRFIATGSDATGRGQVVYLSDDGRTWVKRIVFTSPSFDESMAAITRFGSGYIAVGMRDPATNKVPVTWVSRDGLSWSRGDLLPTDNAASVSRTVSGVAAGPDRIVIVGSTGDPGYSVATIWTAVAGS